jgi:hypothetical protein
MQAHRHDSKQSSVGLLATIAWVVLSAAFACDDASNEVLFRLASEKERLLGIVAMIEGAFVGS